MSYMLIQETRERLQAINTVVASSISAWNLVDRLNASVWRPIAIVNQTGSIINSTDFTIRTTYSLLSWLSMMTPWTYREL